MGKVFYESGDAEISECGAYRYRLGRVLDNGNSKRVVFIMLNPSTADAEEDDNTIRRCRGFARAWGVGRFDVVNLWPFRATAPSDLYCAADPFGPGGVEENLRRIKVTCRGADRIVAAWGSKVRKRDRKVAALAERVVTHGLRRDLHALRVLASGGPQHPLYARADGEPVVWREAWRGGAHREGAS